MGANNHPTVVPTNANRDPEAWESEIVMLVHTHDIEYALALAGLYVGRHIENARFTDITTMTPEWVSDRPADIEDTEIPVKAWVHTPTRITVDDLPRTDSIRVCEVESWRDD